MYKLYKIAKNCVKQTKGLIQVIHTKLSKKGGKSVVFKKLSTLSTQNA